MQREGVTIVIASALCALAANGCSESEVEAKPPFEFVDVAAKSGIEMHVICGNERRWYIPESNGSGAAWLDYDGDGDMDLFIANGVRLAYVEDGKRLEIDPNTPGARLYRNEGKLRFVDVTAQTLPTLPPDFQSAVATGDIDGDGDTDVYLANFGPDVMLRNEGKRFVDATKECGLGCELFGASAAFGDIDNDGDLDLYVANYVEFDLAAPPLGGKREVLEGVEVGWGPEEENKQGLNRGAPDVLYANDGDGFFRDVTKAAGLALEKPLCSYAVVFSDVDGDGLQDILVANDLQPCNLFRNLGRGQFRDEALERGFAFNADGKPTGAMGLAVDDFDGDGDPDVLRTNFDFEANSLHVNNGKGLFVDRAKELGLADASLNQLGWGCGFFDADLDGDADLLIANGHVYPQANEIKMSGWAMPTQFFESTQSADGRLVYREVTRAGSGLADKRSARGIAFGDPDEDGDIDALVIDIDERPRLLENRSVRRGRWLGVKLVGHASNRDGYGAKVTVASGARAWHREMRTTNGLYSSNDPRMHFGVADAKPPFGITVQWPSGKTTSTRVEEIDRVVTIDEEAAGTQ